MPSPLLETSVTKKNHTDFKLRELNFKVFQRISTKTVPWMALQSVIFLKPEPALWRTLELRGVQVLQLHSKNQGVAFPHHHPQNQGPCILSYRKQTFSETP